MYPFGILMILILVCIFSKCRNIDTLFMSLFTFELVLSLNRVNMGYFIKLGGAELMYDDVLLGILFFLSIIKMTHGMKFDKATVSASIFLLIEIAVGIVLLIIWPAKVKVIGFGQSWDFYLRGYSGHLKNVAFSMQSILMFIRVIIFIFILNTAKIIISKRHWIIIGNRVLTFSKGIISFVAIEAVLKLGLGYNLSTDVVAAFGRGVSTTGEVDRLQGLSREPSYLALALFNFCVLCFAMAIINKGRVNRKEKMWICLAIFLGLLSASFSFILSLFGLIGIYYVSRINIKEGKAVQIFFFLIVLVVAIAILFSKQFISFATQSDISVLNRMAESVRQIKNGIFGTYVVGRDYSSEASRFIGMIESFKKMFYRPFFGLGMGTVYCVSGVISILANVGFVGFFTWVYLVFYKYSKGETTLTNIFLLFPVLMMSDMYTMYDTSYLLILPLINMGLLRASIIKKLRGA